MKLVVGLGNPGDKYKKTRHNVGFLVVERLGGEVEWKISKSTGALVSWMEIDGEEIELVKPQKFMNKSGLTVKGIKKKHSKLKNEDIFVVHDDLDIRLGEYKISQKGPRDHNGLKSVYEQIGKDFTHVRVGVDGERDGKSGEEYVLSGWRPEEKEILVKTVSQVVGELKNVLA